MTQPINLNRVRKAMSRADAKKQADVNAVQYGRSKAERMLDATREEKMQSRLDQLKFDDD